MIGPTMKCMMCFETCPRLRSHAIDWLQSACKVDVTYAQRHFSGMHRPVDLPKHRPVFVGRRLVDPSHELMTYRGLIFCKMCGYYAHHKLQNLSGSCVRMESSEAKRRVLRLRAGKLPSGVRDWPNSDTYRQLFLD